MAFLSCQGCTLPIADGTLISDYITLHGWVCKFFQRSFYYPCQRLELFSVTSPRSLNSDLKGYSQMCSLDFHTHHSPSSSVLKEGSQFWNHQAKSSKPLQINKVVVKARSGQKAYRGRASKGQKAAYVTSGKISPWRLAPQYPTPVMRIVAIQVGKRSPYEHLRNIWKKTNTVLDRAWV